MWDVTDTEVKTLWTLTISTHTSRVGCDKRDRSQAGIQTKFLLTHPVWDVTYLLCTRFFSCYISTHTSRVGCDYI